MTLRLPRPRRAGIDLERSRSRKVGTFPVGAALAFVCVQLLLLWYWVNFSASRPEALPTSLQWDAEAQHDIASSWLRLNLLVVVWLAIHVWLRRRAGGSRSWRRPDGSDRLHSGICFVAAAGLSMVSLVVWMAFDRGAQSGAQPVAVFQRSAPSLDDVPEPWPDEDFRCEIDRTRLPPGWAEGLASCRDAAERADVVARAVGPR